MTALGLIETKGLLAAIEGADAMLKAAEVHLLEKNLATGGLVTITIAGEVSAVRASVDAAVAAIRRINGTGDALVSEHVIARPDAELEHIIELNTPMEAVTEPTEPAPSPEPEESSREQAATAKADDEKTGPETAGQDEQVMTEPEKAAEDKKADVPMAEAPSPQASPEPEDKTPAPAKKEPAPYKASQLEKMSVNRLRQIARKLTTISMSPEEIASATKKNLIEAIKNAYRQIEE